jgi:hypothetical protein
MFDPQNIVDDDRSTAAAPLTGSAQLLPPGESPRAAGAAAPALVTVHPESDAPPPPPPHPSIGDIRIPVLSTRNVLGVVAMRGALCEFGSVAMHVLRLAGAAITAWTCAGFVVLCVLSAQLESGVFIVEVFIMSVIAAALEFLQLLLLAQANAQVTALEEKIHGVGTLACDMAAECSSNAEMQGAMQQVRAVRSVGPLIDATCRHFQRAAMST